MKAQVDYLAFRSKDNPFRLLEVVRPAFGTCADLLSLSDAMPGVDGWKYRRTLQLAGDVRLAAIDYGGEHMRDWVRFDMPGAGCEWVQDWHSLQDLPERLQSPEIKRVDLQVTTTDGSLSHARVLAAYDAGQFRTSGRAPSMQQITSSDPTAGRTVYVGKRDQAKFCRCYEKGWETLKGLTPDVRQQVQTVIVDGVGMVPPGDVYRCEVEYKAKDGKAVPWSILADQRDEHFAGANPFFASILAGVVPVKIAGIPQAAAKLDLAVAMHHAARSYGGVIRAAYEACGGDAERVLRSLMAEEPSRVLVESGVLTLATA